ncbi:Luc7-like protein 3 [Entophlyctis sp. JEL0112]|nr:Luc7-like protein 3 [Entophlyctis sp. JEL0112]
MGLDEAGQQAYGGIADAMKNEDDEKEERVAMLEGQIKEHLSQIMELGSAGSVDRAIDMWVTVELLKQNIESIRNATNNRRLVVCEICSATLVANDSTQRMQDHITGKQHVGYKKLREWVKDWENRRASLLGASGGGGAGGGDTRGGWGGPRGRDDHGAGGRRDDRRDHDRRDYDRRDDRGGGGYDRRYRR